MFLRLKPSVGLIGVTFNGRGRCAAVVVVVVVVVVVAAPLTKITFTKALFFLSGF